MSSSAKHSMPIESDNVDPLLQFSNFKRYPFEADCDHSLNETDKHSMPMILQYINGNFSHSVSGQILNVSDTAGEKVIAQVTKSCMEDVQVAVSAAKTALITYHKTPLHSRQHVLDKICERLQVELDRTDSVKEKHEIALSIRIFRYYALWKCNETVHGHLNQSTESSNITYSVHIPVGVIGILLSKRSSFIDISLSLAPALICGNTAVIKVSERGPLRALAFSKVLADIELLPAGLVNFVTGAAIETGAELVRHHDVAKIVFVGSLRVANFALESCQLCRPTKQIWLDLNFKAPALVLADADIDLTVRCVQQSVFGDHSSPTLMTGEALVIDRIYVHKDKSDELIEKLVNMVKLLKENGDDKHVEHCRNGYHRNDCAKTQNYITHHLHNGAHIAFGGTNMTYEVDNHVHLSKSHLQPTVLVSPLESTIGVDNPTSVEKFHAELAKSQGCVDFEEIRSPLVHVVICEDATHMILEVNQQIQFLKQAYNVVFTEEFNNIGDFSRQMRATTILFNDIQVATESHLRDSSVLDFFSDSKSVMWTHRNTANGGSSIPMSDIESIASQRSVQASQQCASSQQRAAQDQSTEVKEQNTSENVQHQEKGTLCPPPVGFLPQDINSQGLGVTPVQEGGLEDVIPTVTGTPLSSTPSRNLGIPKDTDVSKDMLPTEEIGGGDGGDRMGPDQKRLKTEQQSQSQSQSPKVPEMSHSFPEDNAESQQREERSHGGGVHPSAPHFMDEAGGVHDPAIFYGASKMETTDAKTEQRGDDQASHEIPQPLFSDEASFVVEDSITVHE